MSAGPALRVRRHSEVIIPEESNRPSRARLSNLPALPLAYDPSRTLARPISLAHKGLKQQFLKSDLQFDSDQDPNRRSFPFWGFVLSGKEGSS